jgi:hypothetical protein
MLVRRCWNEAADALSKNDMERFWSNVKGDRTLVKLEPHHLAPPLSDSIRGLVPGRLKPQHRGRKAPGIDVLVAQGDLRERQNQTFERRPLRKVPAIPAKATAQQLKQALL